MQPGLQLLLGLSTIASRGMTEDVAKRSIDWLHSTTCRVLALMGGEVLLRPKFAHKVIDYAAKKGFWVYLPTNGRLMKPDVIDRVADAGVATVNLAVDAWDVKPGLPKAWCRSAILQLSGAQTVQVRLLGLPEYQHLPQQPQGCAHVDGAGARQRHRHRLPHLRIAHDGARSTSNIWRTIRSSSGRRITRPSAN